MISYNIVSSRWNVMFMISVQMYNMHYIGIYFVCKYLQYADYIIPVKTSITYIYMYIYIYILCKYILIMRERFHSCHAKSKPYTTICPCQTRHVHRSGITMCFDRAECAIRLPDDMEEEEEEEVLDDDQERVDGWTDMEEPTCKWVCYNINITCCELAVHGPPSACSVFWILAMIVSSHLALAIGSWQPLRAGKYSWWRCQLGHLESKGWWMTSWNPTPRKADRHS